MNEKHRAPRNRTITLENDDQQSLRKRLLKLDRSVSAETLVGRTICQDLMEAIPYLPLNFVDLLILDPPYNLDKSFNSSTFKSRSDDRYVDWLDSWLSPLSQKCSARDLRHGRQSSCAE